MIQQLSTCDGCLLTSEMYLSYEDPCFLIDDGVEYLCPCRKCIIKMMCNDPCDDRDNFRITVQNMVGVIDHESLQEMFGETDVSGDV